MSKPLERNAGQATAAVCPDGLLLARSLQPSLTGDERMALSDQFAKTAWVLGSTAVIVAALYLAKGVLVPLTLAVLLSFLLSPVCDWLERRDLDVSQR